MTIQDPRILITLLNDLIEELRYWKITARETLDQMSWHQRKSEEKVSQALYHASIIQDQAKNDQKLVDQANDEVAQLLSNCYQVLEKAQQNLAAAQNTQNQAQSTLNDWEYQLGIAIDWLRRAEARLELAINEREQAEFILSSAESELQSAQSALTSCQNSGYTDKDGQYHAPNCSGQQARVSQAQKKVQAAIARLNKAIEEEKAAREEVARAQARVNCCRNAIGYAQTAVYQANITLNYAHNALSFAERSLENADAARREVDRAQLEASNEQEMADLMSLAVNNARNFTEEARNDFKGAEKQGNSAQCLEIGVTREIEYRVESLIEFNRPFQF